MSVNTKVATGGQRVLDMYHQCQERSDFYSMVDLSKVSRLCSHQCEVSDSEPYFRWIDPDPVNI